MGKSENSGFFFRNYCRIDLKGSRSSHLIRRYVSIECHDAGHMTKMATMPIHGKNPSKIFFSGTGELISTKLGM